MRIRDALVIACLCFAGSAASGQSPETGPVLYYVPHTHWEGAVFKTREEYLDTGLPNILKALRLLKSYPQFKFTLDQAAYVKPFLERYPEEADAFRQFVREGRLEIVGGMDVMPDVVKPGGELFVRQMQYGKRTFKDLLGVDVTAAWLVDTFGHHPQMPQLLRLAGFDSFWFCRGVPNDDMPSEFLWKGIDGTTIPAFWLPGFYGLFYGPPRDQRGFARFFQDRFNYLGRNTRSDARVGLAGVDVSEPEEYAPPMIAAYNAQPSRPLTIRYSTPSEFAAVTKRRKDLPVRTDDLSPIFQGTFSSRAELKHRTRDVEAKLLTAEKLSAIASLTGAPADSARLWRGWEPLLFNQTHDLASGVMTDHVYEDVQRGYDLSERIADEVTEDRWNRISARIDTRGPGIPVVVFNPLGYARTDAAEVEVGFASGGVNGIEVVDPGGLPVPAQLASADRYPDGAIKRARVAFVAVGVPAVGWSVYHVRPLDRAQAASTPATGPDILENEYFRVKVDLATGAITSVIDKSTGWEALSGPGNVVARQPDRGDLWEVYNGLDGASHIAMTAKESVPESPAAKLSTDNPAKHGNVVHGPVFSEFAISHPLDTGTFATRIRLYRGVRRIDVETTLVNKEKFVRYRVLFPTAIRAGRYVQEIPFGAVERPVGVENAAQQWVDWSDGGHGVALINRGMPGSAVFDGVLMLSLMRSHNLGGYGYGGGYEPGMACETGFELDKPLTFRYSLVPHSGDWRAARTVVDGLAFNQPLIARKASAHGGPWPKSWGLLTVSAPNVVLTSVNPGAGGFLAVRLYEAAGQPRTTSILKLNTRIASAVHSDLMERRGKPLTLHGATMSLDFHPFEVKTILVQPAPPSRPSPSPPIARPQQREAAGR